MEICASSYGPGVRVCVQVVVRQPGKMNRYLACYQQTMDDGRVRPRNLLPSEKLCARCCRPNARPVHALSLPECRLHAAREQIMARLPKGQSSAASRRSSVR